MNIIRLETIPSTNLYAKSNLSTLPDKSVIIADRQTMGRGRLNREWIDLGNDNLFMTVVLKPSNKYMDCYPNITQYMSVVLSFVFEKYGIKPQIKWPNDVLVNGRKIAGILSETVVQGGNFKGLVLGVGVNINADLNSLAEIKDKEATALNLELGTTKVDKEEFTTNLLNEFFENYDKFLISGFPFIREDYLKRACFLNKNISVQVFNEKKSGNVKSVNSHGELVMENDNMEFVLTMGDIL